jgi:hypothetical protein
MDHPKDDLTKNGLTRPYRRARQAGLMSHRHDQDLAIEPNLATSAATDATSST